jgi:hypothetical protein
MRLGPKTLTTGQHGRRRQQPPAHTKKVRRATQPLDQPEPRAARIVARGNVVVAVITTVGTLVGALVVGWWQYGRPAAGTQPSTAATVAGRQPPSKSVLATAPPATVPTTISPVRSSAPEAPAPRAAATLYLANVSGVTHQGSDLPNTENWTISGTHYADSIGYPSMCKSESISFALNGSYTYFIATFGVADTMATSDKSAVIDFEVDDSAGNIITDGTAQYGRPQKINVRIHGSTLIILKTNDDSNPYCFTSNDSVAVWGGARVVNYPQR